MVLLARRSSVRSPDARVFSEGFPSTSCTRRSFRVSMCSCFFLVLRRCSAVGASLPRLPPSGLYERMHLPPRFAYALRRISGRLPVASTAGDEWPHHGEVAPDDIAQIDALAERLDRA